MSDEANNKILFISNLSPLVGAKEHLAELIRLFGIIGKLAEVIVLDNNLERGGAFVIYKKAENAQKAIRILQNYNILGSVIEIQYAYQSSVEFTRKSMFCK